jgi:hypothetical protein
VRHLPGVAVLSPLFTDSCLKSPKLPEGAFAS